MPTNEQYAGSHQAFGNPAHGAQQSDMSLVPRFDNNPPVSPISQRSTVRSSGIPDSSESQRHNRFIHQPQPGFDPDAQTDDVLTHHNPNGSVADSAYLLTGLAGTSQVLGIPYSSEIEVDNEELPPSSLAVREQPQPLRQNPAVSGGADLALARDRARGISKRSRPGKRARKAARNLVQNVKNNVEKLFKPNKRFKTTNVQYTKNRQIGMCLLCKLGGRKQAVRVSL